MLTHNSSSTSQPSSPAVNSDRRVFLYGVGVIAPKAPDTEAFLKRIRQAECVLTPKDDAFCHFLAGTPDFDFAACKPWLEEHHGPKRYSLLNEKSGNLVKYGIGTLIQAVSCHPDLKNAIKALDPRLTIQYATGLADLPVIQKAARELDKALFEWNHYWSQPQRNAALARHLGGLVDRAAPVAPDHFPQDSWERHEAAVNWHAYWSPKSSLQQEYLAGLLQLEQEGIYSADIESAKLTMIRNKIRARKELADKFRAPLPPWEGVSPNLLWNIPNLAASQASMLLNLHGEAMGIAGACASFGTVVNNAHQKITSGACDLAIIGAVDAEPTDELISGFYNGRLAVMGPEASIPFCKLRGTHISGGGCTWILATEQAMAPFNIPHLGVEILGAGVSSDAEHIITPSKEGPKLAIKHAFAAAHITPSDVVLWDMHATGTPGDWNEFSLIEDFVPPEALISARKGIFGHGMAVSGGWELTAQLLGGTKTAHGTLVCPPCGIPPEQVNPKIKSLGRKLLLDKAVEIPLPPEGIVCGKLGLGVGGLSSCVITRILPT